MHKFSDAYQRAILYGGAVMLTVAILVAIAVSVSARIDRFIDDQRSIFIHQRNDVQSAVQLAESHLQGLVLQHSGRESWGVDANTADALLAKYAIKLVRQHGVTVTDKDLTASPYTLVSNDPDYFRMHGSGIVTLLNTASLTPGVQAVAKGIEKGNFVLDAGARIFAFHPAFDASTALADRPREDALALARTETADILDALTKRPDLIAWTKPRRSSLTGEWTIQYGALIERDKKPVAVLGYDIKLADFPSFFLDDHTATPRFYLLSRDGTAVMAGHPDNVHTILDTAQLAADDIPFATLSPPKILRKQGRFLIAQRIRGPEWIALYTFDWSTILHGLRSELTVIALSATAVLILFWGFVLTFDTSVLVPMRRQMRRIFESEAFNRTIVRMAPIGLAVLDAKTHQTVLQNAIANKLLGGSPDAARTFYRTLTKACDEPALAQQLSRGAIMRNEVVVDANNGKPVTIGATFVATRYDDRDVILCGLVDVSRDREMQQLLLAAKCDAEAANHAKSMFLATMSHEIRTPLHAALGNLELLSLHALTTSQHMLVSTIGKSFGALRRLLNDVLDFSKIEAGELRLENVAFDPAELGETCAQAIAPSLAAKGVQLQLLTDASLPTRVTADSLRLQQIIMNLLDNAAKFTAAGRVVLAMTLTQAGRRRLLRVHVIDSGIGMSAHDQTRLFQPFGQVGESTARRFGGTGLGLSLCKRLARLMDGDIRVASAPGAGSTFTVEIPVVAPTASTVVQRGTPPLDGISVLLRCDDEAWREALLARLAIWGVATEVVTTTSFLDANLHDRILLDARPCGDLTDAERRHAQIALDRGLAGIVWLSDTYPLAPEPRDGGIAVSSLSRAALRAALAMAAGIAEPSVNRPALPSIACVRQARLLVVEDDDVARTLLLTQLGTLGFHDVDDVPDGVAAIDCCRHHHYDLILTDLNMPDMCGTEMLARLRQIDIATPVVLISASAPFAGDTHAEPNGFAAIVEKPLSIEQLGALLDRLLLAADKRDRDHRVAHVVGKGATARPAAREKDLWKTFAACWPADRAVVEAKAAAKDVGAFLRRIHKIKGALRVLQDDALAELLGTIEQVARIEGLDAAMPLWARAEAALTSRVDAL
ncbi:ATP-binding protein [Burkholderia multivorans]|uniref:ATP-binding protein n=1 Tax=Burkholderia multivorans TaxID=87883 RepID=UPI0015E48C75|nr:ATP-binding protein [Burkholderia multivorans]